MRGIQTVRRRWAVVVGAAFVAATAAWFAVSMVLPEATQAGSKSLAQDAEARKSGVSIDAEPATTMSASAIPRVQEHEVAPGDTLMALFAHYGFDLATLHAVLAADEELLALDVLRPGTTLRFERTSDGRALQELSLAIQPGRTVHYRRAQGGVFEFEDDVRPTHWHDRVYASSIQGSFYVSASQAGLSDADIDRAQRIFHDRVNFRRDIRAGDHFEIVLGEELADAEPTGRTRIEAIRLQLGSRAEQAFLFDDGNYYDARGRSLNRAFLRYPTKVVYRVSSPFDLHRLHPVTHRIAPHYGVDFAMPVGTPVLSTGDGVVVRTGNHPYAGKYLEIEYPGQFATRYLHLSRILVKRGQHVRRGERIALSGNTGRTTGPHLHFELHVNNRPVNPLTARIPTQTRVPASQMEAFSDKVRTLVATMRAAASDMAAAHADESDLSG